MCDESKPVGVLQTSIGQVHYRLALPTVIPPVPAMLVLTEAHVKEAVLEWCVRRGYAIDDAAGIAAVTVTTENFGDHYDPDIRFTGVKVSLPLTTKIS